MTPLPGHPEACFDLTGSIMPVITVRLPMAQNIFVHQWLLGQAPRAEYPSRTFLALVGSVLRETQLIVPCQ